MGMTLGGLTQLSESTHLSLEQDGICMENKIFWKISHEENSFKKSCN